MNFLSRWPVARAIIPFTLLALFAILSISLASRAVAAPHAPTEMRDPGASQIDGSALERMLESAVLDELGQGGEVTLQHGVSSTTMPIPYGDIVSYTVRLKRSGGSGAFETEVRDAIPFPLHLAGEVEVTLLSGNVSSLQARVDTRRNTATGSPDTIVRWKGSLAPDSEIQIRFPVHVHPICAGESSRQLDAVATTLKPDGSQLSETASVSAACPSFGVSDVGVVQEIVEESADAGGAASRALSGWDEGVAAYRVARVRTTFTNGSQTPLTLLAVTRLHHLDAAQSAGPAAVLGEWPMGRLSLAPGESASNTMALVSPCGKQTQCNLSALETALARIPAENEPDVQLMRSVRFVVIPADLPSFSFGLLEPGQIGENAVNFPLRPWDVGDAPDSTNHTAGAAGQMPAYPNGTVARFPTVFDPATDPGGAQGPASARPRFLHLGRNVEVEPDADVGPLPLNIEPAANLSDQDGDDDGLLLASLNFQDCQKSTFQVEVFVHANALTYFQENEIGEVYLNAWLDSDRSGAWDGTFACAGGTALEHFVMDQALPVSSLSAGLNLITVTSTSPISWPAGLAEQPVWMRLILSERKSNKTLSENGNPFGDGRGYATPNRTGEVEDYFIVPTIDYGVRMQSQAHYDPNLLDRARQMDALIQRRNTYIIKLFNRGQQSSDGIQFELEIPEGEIFRSIEIPGYIGCLTCTAAVRGPAARIRFKLDLQQIRLQRLDPKNLTIVVETQGWTGCLTCTLAAALPTAKVTVLTSDEVAANNSASKIIKGEFRPIFGWTTESGLPLRREGTTREGTINLRGLGRPGAPIEVSVWKAPANASVSQRSAGDHCDISDPNCPVTHIAVTPDANGLWNHTFAGLNDGRYRITAVYSGAPAQSRFDAAVVEVNVDSSLLYDSLLLTGSAGASFYIDLGFLLGEWPANVSLVPGQSYQVRLRVKPGVQPSLLLPAERVGNAQIDLKDEDADNVWEGSFTWGGSMRADAGAAEVSLLLRAGDLEVSYAGPVEDSSSGLIRDLTTGQPIQGATVQLTEERSASGNQVVYVPWDGAQYGAVNPILSPANGMFRFAPPRGVYRLLVEKAGYQPFRGEAIALESGGVVQPFISLTPQTMSADVTIVIGEGGYSANPLRVRPGTTVRWLNADTTDHRVARLLVARVSAATTFDSGVLAAGESYSYTFTEEGTFGYSDISGGLNTGSVIVDPNAPVIGIAELYLPTIIAQ